MLNHCFCVGSESETMVFTHSSAALARARVLDYFDATLADIPAKRHVLCFDLSRDLSDGG